MRLYGQDGNPEVTLMLMWNGHYERVVVRVSNPVLMENNGQRPDYELLRDQVLWEVKNAMSRLNNGDG